MTRNQVLAISAVVVAAGGAGIAIDQALNAQSPPPLSQAAVQNPAAWNPGMPSLKSVSGAHALVAGNCQSGAALLCDFMADDGTRMIVSPTARGTISWDGGEIVLGRLVDGGLGFQVYSPVDAGPPDSGVVSVMVGP